jgi:uncharacterized Zn finger protein (UPF0148 family)
MSHCPACERPLYSRRNKFCGFCGVELPGHLLFTPEEIEALEKKEKDLEALSKQRLLEREAEEIKKRNESSWFEGGGLFTPPGL